MTHRNNSEKCHYYNEVIWCHPGNERWTANLQKWNKWTSERIKRNKWKVKEQENKHIIELNKK